jgi:ubiquitin-like domain-containing CTD phosphatase 1
MEDKTTAIDTTNSGITLIAKWGKEKIVLEGLTGETTIGNVKDLIEDRTGVLQKRQKLIGLATNGGAKVTDDLMISDLKIKSGKSQDGYAGVVHSFIMMGSREEHIFVDPSEREDLPDVIDDFDLDFNAGSSEVRNALVAGVPLLGLDSLSPDSHSCSGFSTWPTARISRSLPNTLRSI